MSVTTVIEEMVSRIVREFDPIQIILFGSPGSMNTYYHRNR